MYLLMAEKANKLLQKYRVQEFPISLELIEHILNSEGIDIRITRYLKRALYCDNIIYIGQALEHSCRREYLAHETAHSYHYGNTTLQDPVSVDKNEGQASAFTAYFLMPVGLFESYLACGENNYTLAELFGVKQSLIETRKLLSCGLIESGIFYRLKEEIQHLWR